MRLGSLYTALTTENGSCDALVIWREGRLKGRPPQQFDDQQEAWVATAAAYALTAAGLDPAEATERVSAIAANVGGFEIKPEKIRAKLSGLSASTRKDLDALHKGRPVAEVEDKVRRSLAWMSLASAEDLTAVQ